MPDSGVFVCVCVFLSLWTSFVSCDRFRHQAHVSVTASEPSAENSFFSAAPVTAAEAAARQHTRQKGIPIGAGCRSTSLHMVGSYCEKACTDFPLPPGLGASYTTFRRGTKKTNAPLHEHTTLQIYHNSHRVPICIRWK